MEMDQKDAHLICQCSQFLNAELDEKGDLIIIGQDVGKAAMPTAVNYAHWGDEDYEF